MKKIVNYFKKLDEQDNIGHAFLIGNILFDDYRDELEEVLSKYIFKDKINIEEEVDVSILKPETSIITKEQLKNLLANLSITSQNHGVKVYIITEAEKLSANVYNSLLKTIEEPEENIIAFLITSNIDNIIDTIKSRCQIVQISSDSEFEDDCLQNESIAEKLILSIEKNGTRAIASNSDIYKIISDREMLISVLNYMLKIYIELLNCILKSELNERKGYKYVLECNDENTIGNKILVINDLIAKTNSYLSKNIIIDKLIIELRRCSK